jgi:hypothetical protein
MPLGNAAIGLLGRQELPGRFVQASHSGFVAREHAKVVLLADGAKEFL